MNTTENPYLKAKWAVKQHSFSTCFLRTAFLLPLLFSGTQALSEPVLTLTYPSSWLIADRPFEVICSVAWQGDPTDYTVLPVQCDGLEKATWSLVRSESWRDGDLQVISQTLAITPSRSGSLTIPALKVAVVEPDTPMMQALGKAGHIQDSEARLILRSDPVTLRLWTPTERNLLILSPSVLVLIVLAVLGYRLWGRRRAVVRVEPDLALAQAQSHLHAARQHRLDEAYYEFYQALVQAMEGLGVRGQALEVLERRSQAVGFQGDRPSEAALDEDLKRVEAAMKAYREAATTTSTKDNME